MELIVRVNPNDHGQVAVYVNDGSNKPWAMIYATDPNGGGDLRDAWLSQNQVHDWEQFVLPIPEPTPRLKDGDIISWAETGWRGTIRIIRLGGRWLDRSGCIVANSDDEMRRLGTPNAMIGHVDALLGPTRVD